LTRKEIQINQARDDGMTPLYIACQQGHVKVVEALLTNKEIDIFNKQFDGYTPLKIAIQQGHTEIAALLQQHGAK
jgi:ankyrin repeat protein